MADFKDLKDTMTFSDSAGLNPFSSPHHRLQVSLRGKVLLMLIFIACLNTSWLALRIMSLTQIRNSTAKLIISIAVEESQGRDTTKAAAFHSHDSSPRIEDSFSDYKIPTAIASASPFSDDILQEIQRLELKRVSPTHGLVLVGIFCTAQDATHRHLLRATNHHLAPRGVTLRFVVCRPMAKGDPDLALQAEIVLHDDILLLDSEENMDEGKSILYFRTVARLYPGFFFYAKTDIDSYNLYFNLALALDVAPTCGLYMGQYRNYITDYNVGHLYVLSKDLVEVIQDCQLDYPDTNKWEDVVTGQYLHELAPNIIQWGDWGPRHVIYGADGTMLGEPKRRGGPPLQHLFTPWVILVHGVKPKDWMNATSYFKKVISVESIRASASENFVDGSKTNYWNLNCTGRLDHRRYKYGASRERQPRKYNIARN